MATINLYLANATSDNWRRLTETTQAAATINDGWVVGTGSTNHSEYFVGVERAASTFTGTTVPDGTLDTANFDAFRSENPYSGSFAAANWVVHFVVRSVTSATGQDGRIRFRLIKADANGSNAVEITGSQQQASAITDVDSASDEDSTLTFNPGAFTIENQYLFLQIAWERTGAASMTTADVNWRTGSSTTVGTRLTTANFQPTPQLSAGSVTLAGLAPSLAFAIGLTAGALGFTSQAPTVINESPAKTITLAAGSLIHRGQYVDVAFSGPPTGEVAYTGQAPTVSVGGGGTDTTINVPAGSLVVAGQAPSVAYGITPAAGSVVWSGTTTTVLAGKALDVPAGTITYTGQAPALAFAADLPVGRLTLTGQAPSLAETRSIPAGTVTYTGAALTPISGLTANLSAGALTFTGRAPTIDATVALQAGVLTFTGQTVGVGTSITATPGAGSLIWTGQALNPGHTLGLTAGTLRFTGQAPTVAITKLIAPSAGTLTFTGQPLALAFTTAISAGTLTFTGQAPSVSAGTLLAPQVGRVVFTGQAATPLAEATISIPAGTLQFAGQISTQDFVLAMTPGAVAFDGQIPTVLNALPLVGQQPLTGTYVITQALTGTQQTSTPITGSADTSTAITGTVGAL
jgi:hypothetical protein